MIAHYRLIEKLGEGGMGVVWRATDTRLQRDIALKILPSQFTGDPERNSRFLREARSAASIIHPNIATIFDAGESAGTTYIAMELVEGIGLRRRLSDGMLSVEETIRIARDIGRGLSRAHEAGIVHRDLKPDNIMLDRENRAKILDFGLAKLMDPPSGGSTVNERTTVIALTERGCVVGTAAYMSPEQARGETVDARTDIFSFGVCLYEMITGRLPFRGSNPIDILSAVIREDPAPVQNLNPVVPRSLATTISRCLAKEPSERFQSMAEALRALSEPVPRKRRPGRGVSAAVATLFLIVLGAVGIEWLRDRSVTDRATPTMKPVESVAVLPLRNLSKDPNEQYFVDGMTEMLITSLGSIDSIRVISRSSSMRFIDSDWTASEIAGALGVETLVEGSVARAGDRIRVTVQLVDAASDSQIWTGSYEQEFRDVLALQGDVARAIADGIRAHVTPEEAARLTERPPIDPEAYRLYLRGRYSWSQWTPDHWQEAIEYYRKSIDKDPTFAPAYAGMADAYGVLSVFNVIAPADSLPKAMAAARQAIAIDPRMGEAHASLGMAILQYEWNWPEAERSFQRGIELSPDYVDAHRFYGIGLAAVGRFAQAIERVEHARQLDPFSPAPWHSYVWVLTVSRRFSELEAFLRREIDMDSSSADAHQSLSVVLRRIGREDEAFQHFLKARQLQGIGEEQLGQLRSLFVADGFDGLLREQIQRIIRGEGYRPPVAIADLYASLGDAANALKWLWIAFDERASLIWLRADPTYDSIRSDPSFQELIESVGLPWTPVERENSSRS